MRRAHERDNTNAERRRELASILARGVIRWHRRAKGVGITAAGKSEPLPKNCLELSGETRLTVGTRGLKPRSDGDEA